MPLVKLVIEYLRYDRKYKLTDYSSKNTKRLDGKTVVITGTPEGWKREELAERLRAILEAQK